ncbi:hypothetical protein I546_6817 [Mycobacterium kansasii 732]|uniref:Transmembrane protein n=1 Tax=Mycobacterium pseudokansasii TaxID=2341080 RepID=A0A498QSR1_9MYCO|nr:phage holin family protein [Mycobacterium pseudokansasii]ETZ98637.1 hypothetical protein I546_6817 [Mycobacterium kansasii 732]KZS65314.1 hypothetical protein A4G27_02440 [Mycobacterium kansasii]MBY0389601.1 phage holin family protein [Mycobacterium pseudokansasii]VAZ96732.1 hypothetical protein LAUMK35_03455 [Mycobacterium pseudokansasii]VAZ98175.1 hypothetical protein LAUMK21_03452 [Mycobacterium pseudokansasii]
MLIIALVLALIGLVALVFAVVTSNVLVAWVCIGASVLGVILLIVDAIRERQHRDAGGQDRDEADEEPEDQEAVDYPDDEAGVDESFDDAEGEVAEESEESAVSADRGGDDSTR